jgi:6-pyruvoyltetrahydropterin/6-carboxytetrahydropterin synthase
MTAPEETKTLCVRAFEFDAGHRVRGHETKCRHLHGHRYRVEASFAAERLDGIGRIVDFGVVKERLGAWLDANWDHALLLHEDDKPVGDAILAQLPFQHIFYLPCNPTAENMALYVLRRICPPLFAGIGCECVSVTVWETPNCRATALL